ncbi:hypothetical protein ES703_70452 [subsurface metagenome]
MLPSSPEKSSDRMGTTSNSTDPPVTSLTCSITGLKYINPLRFSSPVTRKLVMGSPLLVSFRVLVRLVGLVAISSRAKSMLGM